MTTATIPRLLHQEDPTLSPMPSELEFLNVMAARSDIGVMCYYGEQEQLAHQLVQKGYARRFDPLRLGAPSYVITPAGVERLAALTRPADGELRAALGLLVRTARENAARDWSEGNPVPRLRKARQKCAWLSRELDHKAPQFPYLAAFNWLLLAGHLEPVTTWLSGSRWTVGWALTESGRALYARLSAPIPATRALVVSPPRALVVAGHFPPVPKPAPAPAPKPQPVQETLWQWQQRVWRYPQVKVQGRKGKRYWVVRTPDGERHDSLPRTFYTDWKASKEGDAFAEKWWDQHWWEASHRETFEYDGVTVELKKLRYTRGGWWKWRRTDGGCGEGITRTKREAVAAAKADIDEYKPKPKPAPKSPSADKPRAPFSSENVKIGAGRWDAGAFHRALEVARALYDAGRLHGLGTLYINHPYTTHTKFARAGYEADVLVTGEDYRVELF